MRIIRELENQYFEIENQYSAKEFEAHVNGSFLKESFWRRKRELNTHAYFLFVFTRLEDHIKTQTISLIADKRANISPWKTRAIWDNTDDQKLHFKKRVGLLTEKGHTEFNKIIDYYDLRNTIAHGGTISAITTTINMIDVFDDMKRYYKELKK
jgi:hypothetical protein